MRRAAVALLALVLGGCAVARSLDPRTARFPPVDFTPPAIVETALSGGTPVFLLEDRDVPLVRLYAAFRGGSAYDPPAKAGLADVTALAWRTGGAGALSPEAFDEALEGRAVELGLHLGRESGWVSLSLLPADLEPGLDLLALLLAAPTLREDRVAWARTQVAERLRREGDNPQELAFREFRRALYRGHPRGVIPTPETVARITREDVADLQGRVVRKGAWALGAVGAFDPRALAAALEARLGGVLGRGGAFSPLPPPVEPPPATVLVPKPLAQTTVLWGRLGPGRLAADFAAVDLADHLLGGGGFQSRLVQEIRSNRGLAYSVGSFYQALPGFGVLGMQASTRGDAAAAVVALFGSVPGDAAVHGFGDEELRLAQDALVNRHVFRYEDSGNTVRERVAAWVDGTPPDLPIRYPEEIEAVTGAAAAGAAARFDPRAGVLVLVGPVDPSDPAWGARGPVEVVGPGDPGRFSPTVPAGPADQ